MDSNVDLPWMISHPEFPPLVLAINAAQKFTSMICMPSVGMVCRDVLFCFVFVCFLAMLM